MMKRAKPKRGVRVPACLSILGACISMSGLLAVEFRRGDVNVDGRVDLHDVAVLGEHIFSGVGQLRCEPAADANVDGTIDVNDLVELTRRATHPELALDSGTDLPAPGSLACGGDAGEVARCMDYPQALCTRVSTRDADASVRVWIEPPDPALPPQESWATVFLMARGLDDVTGWQIALRSTAPIHETSTERTIAAPAAAGGLLDDSGLHDTHFIDGAGQRALLSSTLLSRNRTPAQTLPPDLAHPILQFRGDVTTRGCVELTVVFDDALTGAVRQAPLNIITRVAGTLEPARRGADLIFCNPLELAATPTGLKLPLDFGLDDRSLAVRVATTDIAPEASSLTVELRGAGGLRGFLPGLRLRQEEFAGRRLQDRADVERARDVRRLVIPRDALNRDLHVLLERQTSPATLESVDLCIAAGGGALESLSVTTATAGDTLPASVRGVGFEADTRLELSAESGARAPVTVLRVLSSTRLEVLLDLADAEPGLFDLVLVDGDEDQGILRDVLRVLPANELPGERLDVDVSVRPFLRFARVRPLTLSIENPGNLSVPLPLVRLSARTAIELGTDSADRRAEDLLVLPNSAGTLGGIIAPGACIDVSLVIEGRELGESQLRADLFDDGPDDRVDWESVPAPPATSPAEWHDLRDSIAADLGETWPRLLDSLRAASDRLRLRGAPATSALELLQFASRRALEIPNGAMTGRLVDAEGAGVGGAMICAERGGDVLSSARTSADGGFILDWLHQLVGYRVVVVDHSIVDGDAEVFLAGELDALDRLLVVEPGANGIVPGCPDCRQDELPTRLPETRRLDWTPATATDLEVIAGRDPNIKEARPGQRGVAGFRGTIEPGTEVSYTIFFENAADASAAEQIVRVVDELDERFDLSTFRFGEVGFGEHSIPLDLPPSPYDGTSCAPEVTGDLWNVTASRQLTIADHEIVVRVDGDLTAASGEDPATISWLFQTLDPSPCGEPLDDLAGFLPPNNEEGIGEGWVSFEVSLRDDIEEPPIEEDLTNRASIRFDQQGVIVTDPPAIHSFENRRPPDAPEFPRPFDGAMDVATERVIAWDEAPRADSYEVFLWRSTDAPPAVPSASGLAIASWLPSEPLDAATEYRWRVVALNEVGETSGATWSFTTGGTSGLFVRGDVDGSEAIELTDAIVILQFLFAAGTAPTCLDASDTNDDDNVDISDAVRLLAWLFIGGQPLPPPAAPTPSVNASHCGIDPTPDSIDCASFDLCE